MREDKIGNNNGNGFLRRVPHGTGQNSSEEEKMSERTPCLCGCGKYPPTPGAKWVLGHWAKSETNKQKLREKCLAEWADSTHREKRVRAIRLASERPVSEETKQKIREARKRQVNTNKGFKFSPDQLKRLSDAHKGHKLSEQTKEKIRKAMTGRKITWSEKVRNSLMGVNSLGFAAFNTYAPQLAPAQECRKHPEDPRILQTPCVKCGEWFTPNIFAVQERLSAILGKNSDNGDRHLYCSDSCKKACSIYGATSHYKEGHSFSDDSEVLRSNYRSLQNAWRNEVLRRDQFECQKCGLKDQTGCLLIAHHIDPVKCNPIESADIDNGITLCIECDREVHQLPGCTTGELASYQAVL